jgi:stage III sporulation protein AE
MSALLLGACEIISFLASFVVLPLMGGYLALSISSAVSPLVNRQGVVESVKKLSMWIMSLLSTLFIGVLGIQTAVNSAKDSVSLRTAKFILGTSVPVAGGVLSEAVSTISTSMGLLRSSIGIYGIVALGFILLPIVVEIIL